jgi:hypothetical protein
MLPFALTNFTVDVDIHAVADGGVWLRGDGTGQNGILLVTGGDGWGWGSRIGNAGKALYFHVVTNGAFSPYLGEATNVFTPEVSDVHLRIQVNGNTYSAFTNGNTTPTCSITDTNFTSGQVGLFAFSTQTFDNFAISNLPPVLDIHNGVVISWPADYTGYVLEETTNPASSNWVAVPIPPRVVNQVILPSAEGNKFFRLRKP